MSMRGYRDGVLHVDGVDLRRIVSALGTPCYVYSRQQLESNWRAYDGAFGTRRHRVHYAVKANDNLSILRVLKHLGSGFDIVSGGELERVLAAGASAADVVFSGVGKSRSELSRAISAGVACINVESRGELERVAELASELQQPVKLALRVNPDVDPKTHPYISTGLKENKFGVPLDEALALYRTIAAHPLLRAAGIASHIGSQLTDIEPVLDAVTQVVNLAESLRAEGIVLEHIDVGGGLGISYQDETPPPIEALVAAVCERVPPHYAVMMEPGRSLIGAAGTLLTTVEYLKTTEVKTFAIVDAAMNDLMRPALYDAWHGVVPLMAPSEGEAQVHCDVVGPVCESGDWLARARDLPAVPGAVLAILDAGAYGFAMTSNYNARPRPPEVLVEGDSFSVIRARESLPALMANERDHLIP
jgi:diaminopimelate decarboxylase